MSQGTLFGEGSTRCILPIGIIKAYGLDITVSKTGSDAQKAAFPTLKVPAFIGEHGFKLQEAIAVIYYCMYYSNYYLLLSQIENLTIFYYNDEKNSFN